MRTIVMSLGGSLIIPENLDLEFIKRFKQFVLSYIKKGYRFVIITGGGRTARYYKESACKISELDERDKHLIGVRTTQLNAEFIRSIFGKEAYPEVIIDYNKKLFTNKKIVIGAGFKPGTTSDFETTMWALNFGVRKVINLSNIECLYTADPNKDKNAKRIRTISWKSFRKMFRSDNSGGGRHFPFDPIASRVAQENGITTFILGKDLNNLGNLIEGKEFVGTTIS